MSELAKGREKERHLVLFHNLLLETQISSAEYHVKRTIPLDGRTRIQRMESGSVFQIITGSTIVFTGAKEDVRDWVEALQEAVDICQILHQTNQPHERKKNSN